MAKSKIFSDNNDYQSKYYSKKGRSFQRVRRKLYGNKATSGAGSQTRYKLLMDTLTEDERDRVRETYASDEIFEIGDIVQDENVYFKEAEEIYNERITSEVDALLNGI